MHALVASLVLLPLQLGLRQRGEAICLGIASIYLCFLVQPWALWLPAASPTEPRQQSLEVLSWNLLSVNRSFSEMEDLILEVDPDLIVLIEVRPGLLDDLPQVTHKYPYHLLRPDWGGSGIAVLSRVKETRLAFKDFQFPQQPAIVASVPGNDGSELQLVALHALSPLPAYRTAIRNRQIRSFANWSETQTGPLCVCGDFNITPWTGPFQELLDLGFVDSRIGVGNCPSWPAQLGVFGIPIDHALSKGACHISDRTVLPAGLGSDHRPIRFTVSF